MAKSITLIGLNTKPVAPVRVQIEVDTSIVVFPTTFVIGKNNSWKNISQKISFRAKNGASSATARIVCSSDDQKYNLFVKLSIIVQPLLRTLNIPAEGTVVEGKAFIYKMSLTTVPISVVTVLFTLRENAHCLHSN